MSRMTSTNYKTAAQEGCEEQLGPRGPECQVLPLHPVSMLRMLC